MPRREHYEYGTPCWIDCLSGEPGESATFYHRLFGWHADTTHEHWLLRPDAVGNAAAGQPQTALIGGLGLAPRGMPSCWTTYLSVPDVPAALQRAQARGGMTVLPPFAAGSDGVLALILDPCGQLVGLWQGAHDEGVVVADEPNAVGWHELRTVDPDRSADFYAEVVGMRREGQALFAGDHPVATIGPATGAPGWQVCFAVDDIQSGAARALDAGARLLATLSCGPSGLPGVELADPQGARFLLCALG